MYTVIISLLLGVGTGVGWYFFGPPDTWGSGIVLGVIVFVLTFVIIARVLKRRIEPVFDQVQKQVQGGASANAIRSLEELLPLANWQVMLKGQIYAQLGTLSFGAGDSAKALEYLEKATPRAPEAQMFRASLLFQAKRTKEALKVLDTAISYSKKQLMLYHVYAWMLLKADDREGAIAQMQRCLKVEKSNESSKEALLRLQNGKKLNMNRFGMNWYSLQLENLPAAMRQQMGQGTQRKGFRQRKKRR